MVVVGVRKLDVRPRCDALGVHMVENGSGQGSLDYDQSQRWVFGPIKAAGPMSPRPHIGIPRVAHARLQHAQQLHHGSFLNPSSHPTGFFLSIRVYKHCLLASCTRIPACSPSDYIVALWSPPRREQPTSHEQSRWVCARLHISKTNSQILSITTLSNCLNNEEGENLLPMLAS